MLQHKKIKKLKQKFNNRTLAYKYETLRKYIQINNKNETIIDYNNQEALNELNYCIMDYYFGIKEYRIPLTQMIPSIGCRLNYIQWVKEQVDKDNFNVECLYDVGTGFNGILLFLGYRLYGWKGIGIDINKNAIEYAQKIAQQNNIDVQFKVGDKFEYLQNGMVTVCNPPFYDINEKRQYNRVIQQQESFIDGGEVNFVNELIQQSNKDCLYTCMLGRKQSISKFKDEFDLVELHQGNNIRYGIKWKKQLIANQPKSEIN